MELSYETFLNFNKYHFYTETLKNNNELCIICLLDEQEENKQWDRYKLACGHIFHTRCFRKWCDKKQSLNCPYCNNIPLIDKNYFCFACNTFGHKPLSCIDYEDSSNDEDTSYDDNISIPNNENNIDNDFYSCPQETKWICNICNSKLKFNYPTYINKHYNTKKCINARSR